MSYISRLHVSSLQASSMLFNYYIGRISGRIEEVATKLSGLTDEIMRRKNDELVTGSYMWNGANEMYGLNHD